MVQRKRKTTTPKRKSPKRTRRTSPKKKRRTSPRRKIRSKRLNPPPVRGYYNRFRNYFDGGDRQTGYNTAEAELERAELEKRKLIVSAIKDRYRYIHDCFSNNSPVNYQTFHKKMNKRITEEKKLPAFKKIPNYTVDETYIIKHDALTDLLNELLP